MLNRVGVFFFFSLSLFLILFLSSSFCLVLLGREKGGREAGGMEGRKRERERYVAMIIEKKEKRETRVFGSRVKG